MIVFCPRWSINTFELIRVPATPKYLAPYEGLRRSAKAGLRYWSRRRAHASQGGRGHGSSGGNDSDIESESCGLFVGLADAVDAAPIMVTDDDKAQRAVQVAARRRRAKRQLVSAHLIADALHRLAWQVRPWVRAEAG